jgi:hypothetical protein
MNFSEMLVSFQELLISSEQLADELYKVLLFRALLKFE